jgi:hypothetical protein
MPCDLKLHNLDRDPDRRALVKPHACLQAPAWITDKTSQINSYRLADNFDSSLESAAPL